MWTKISKVRGGRVSENSDGQSRDQGTLDLREGFDKFSTAHKVFIRGHFFAFIKLKLKSVDSCLIYMTTSNGSK